MAAGGIANNSVSANTRHKRAEYARHYKAVRPATAVRVCIVPDDIIILTRDPSPCFMCGDRGACRHRPWERDLIEQSA